MSPGPPLRWTLLRRTAQNFAFFPLSRPFSLFLFLSWVSSRGILVVFEAPEHSNVHVWALGLSCETWAALHEKTPKETQKRATWEREREKKARNFGPPPSGSHPPLEWRAWAPHCLSHRCLCLLVSSSLLFFILFFSFIDEKKLVLCGWAKRLRHQFWPKSATQILAKVGQIFWPQSDWPKVGLAKVGTSHLPMFSIFMKDKLCFASKRHAHHACRCPSVLFGDCAHSTSAAEGWGPTPPVFEQTANKLLRNLYLQAPRTLGHCTVIDATSAPPFLRCGWAGFTKDDSRLSQPRKCSELCRTGAKPLNPQKTPH